MKLSFRHAQKIGALATALALASLLAAGPAQAHDARGSSSPSNGDTVTTNPGKVSITLTKSPARTYRDQISSRSPPPTVTSSAPGKSP